MREASKILFFFYIKKTYKFQYLHKSNVDWIKFSVLWSMRTRKRLYAIYEWQNQLSYFQTDNYVKKQNKLNRMNWLIQLFDFNSIENLWRLIKKQIIDKRHRIRSVDEMKQIIEFEWELLTVKNFRRSIKNMPDRCRTVVQAREKATKYWFRISCYRSFWIRNKWLHMIRKFFHAMVDFSKGGVRWNFRVLSEPDDHFRYVTVQLSVIVYDLNVFMKQLNISS